VSFHCSWIAHDSVHSYHPSSHHHISEVIAHAVPATWNLLQPLQCNPASCLHQLTGSRSDVACHLTHHAAACLPACHAPGPPTLDPSLPPEQAAFHNPRVAALYLGYMGLMLLVCTAIHLAIIFAWTHIKYTAAKPLPSILQFPAAELLLLNLLALPATMYAMLLMVQAPVQAQRVLGVAVFLLVLGYLWFITALLLFIVRKKTALSLCGTAAGPSGDSSSMPAAASAGCGRTALAAVPCFAAPGLQSQPSQGLSTTSSLSMQDSAMLLLPHAQLSAHMPGAGATGAAVNTPDLVVITEDDSAGGRVSMDSTGSSSSFARWWRPGGGLKEMASWGSTSIVNRGTSSLTKHDSANTLWVGKSTDSSTWQSAGAEADAVEQAEGELCCITQCCLLLA
jgi:hypothetical protein